MERGDLAAVIIGLVLVVILAVILSPPAQSPRQAPIPDSTTRVPAPAVTPVPEATKEPAPGLPTPPQVTTRRISYTNDYFLFPVRFLPGDMSRYGSSDAPWQYSSPVAFAYIEENHGGITETFTVPYPVWRMTSTVYATRTPENARFRMILVDEGSGQIVNGVEIRFPGTVTKTVVARGRPLYIVIEAENVERFTITLETPSVYAR
jgi:hypothetical protein